MTVKIVEINLDDLMPFPKKRMKVNKQHMY